ncbi:ATP-binding protein, partial [Vibrio anguillarum]
KTNPLNQFEMLVEQHNSATGMTNSFSLVDDCNPQNQDFLGSWLSVLQKQHVQQQLHWPPFRGLANLVAEFGCVAASRNAGKTERNAFNYGNVLPLIKIIQQLSEDSR